MGCLKLAYRTNDTALKVVHRKYVRSGNSCTEAYRYGMNGMEKDDEIVGSGNNYDFGARHYDSRLGRWWSVDPLASAFPNMSPYAAFNNNPLRFTDPTGAAPEDWVGKKNENGTTSWSWDDNIKSADQAKAAGYDDYKAPGSIIDNSRIGGGELGSVYLGNSKNDVSYTTPNKTVTPFQVGTEWLSGEGPRHRDFTSGDYFTELLKQHDHVGATKDIILGRIANGGELTGKNPYELDGVQGVGKYIKDYSTLLTAGQTGNLAVTYLGSYTLNWNVTGINNGSATVLFTVNNTSTMQSASRPPIIGYYPIWQNTVGKAINNYFSTGWGSKTSQSFNWTETLPIK